MGGSLHHPPVSPSLQPPTWIVLYITPFVAVWECSTIPYSSPSRSPTPSFNPSEVFVFNSAEFAVAAIVKPSAPNRPDHLPPVPCAFFLHRSTLGGVSPHMTTAVPSSSFGASLPLWLAIAAAEDLMVHALSGWAAVVLFLSTVAATRDVQLSSHRSVSSLAFHSSMRLHLGPCFLQLLQHCQWFVSEVGACFHATTCSLAKSQALFQHGRP